jgi:hypothetical protein
MSHPARGPGNRTGIDGKASADQHRHAEARFHHEPKMRCRMRYPARGPVEQTGIDGKASTDQHRHADAGVGTLLMEVAA